MLHMPLWRQTYSPHRSPRQGKGYKGYSSSLVPWSSDCPAAPPATTLPAGATLPWMLTWKLLLSSPAGLVARQVYKPASATYTKPGEGKIEA